MKWWMRDDWQERLMIAVAIFILLFGIGEAIFGGGGFQRWVPLALGAVVLVLSVVRFRQRQNRDTASEDESSRH